MNKSKDRLQMKDHLNIILTPNQEAYAQAFVSGEKPFDKSAAYRASYSTSKMKPETIHRRAQDIFNNSNVQARIKQLQEKTAKIAEKKFNITAEEMLRHLDILRNARIDQFVKLMYEKVITAMIDDNGEPIYQEVPRVIFKPFDELTPEQLMCIESIKETRYGIELKLHGKEWTIEKINKHIGFYEKDNQQKAGDLNTEDKKALLAKILEKAKK